MSDVIAAIATANVLSAIGIIRLSGDSAAEVAGKVFKPNSGKNLSDVPTGKMTLGKVYDVTGAVIDECLCFHSKAPNSYTGEDTAEIQCHGSPAVLASALEALFNAGARQALAGEFTKRAFLNGRMDLTQAEAVIDLISAETAEAARNAAGQLSGVMGRKIDSIYDSLTNIMAHFHAVLDYPDEDIEDFQLQDFEQTLQEAHGELDALYRSYDRGRMLKSGVSCAIVGRPNAGKSSLLNALLGYDRAIVTEIAGTTRDTITESVRVGGVLLRMADTAGLRATDDPVEKAGVERAFKAADGAQLALAVFDGSVAEADEETIRAAATAQKSIAVVNKSDLPQQLDVDELKKHFDHVCVVSAAESKGLDALDKAVAELFDDGSVVFDGGIVTNERHAEAVKRARDAIAYSLESMYAAVTPDAVLVDVEAAMEALAEITGRLVSEDVTGRIFERFCVGK